MQGQLEMELICGEGGGKPLHSERGRQSWLPAGACGNKGLCCLEMLEHFPLNSVASRGHVDYFGPACRSVRLH